MAADYKQTDRIAKLTTPLGPDVLVLSSFHAAEGLSELFDISVDCLSKTEDIDFNSLIGQACTITINSFAGAKRFFNGILVSAEWHGAQDDAHGYRLVLRPWLWLLGGVSDCRIFHEKSAVDIIREVFTKRGFHDFRFATTPQSYPKMEYCVQYRETDLAFVQRLMEQFGIYFFFEHSDGRHVLVLADAKSSHKPVENLASIRYEPPSSQNRHSRQWIGVWISARNFRSGKAVFNDYNFKTPTANMLAQKPQPESYTHGTMELYDYPGRYPVLSEGEDIAKVKVESEQAGDRRRSGSGDAPSLVPGGLVKLQEHPRGSENIEYLVVRCRHSFRGETYRSGNVSTDVSYTGAYEFIPSDRRFRAPLITPKPIVYGPQTAVVTGAKGEEIDVDKYGRILVRFHWDRDKGQSCRVRVAQIWAGKSWGGQVIPRIGQEVIVEFLEGDPDRPVVTGTVYNADNMPPYSLPDNKTMAGVKSNSTKGGGGYNEFVFEDKKGSENIRMHGEKDHEVVILNSESVKIGEKFMPPMGVPSRDHEIKNGDDKLKVASGSRKINVAMNQSLDVGMMRTEKIGLTDELKVGLMRNEKIGVMLDTKSGAIMALTGGAVVTIKGGGAVQVMAGGMVSITAPLITLTGIVKVTGLLVLSAPPLIIPGS